MCQTALALGDYFHHAKDGQNYRVPTPNDLVATQLPSLSLVLVFIFSTERHHPSTSMARQTLGACV